MKKTVENLIALLVRFVNRLIPQKGILICAPAVPEKNKGDQALLSATLDHLAEINTEPVYVIQTGQPIESVREVEGLRYEKQFAILFTTFRCFSERIRFLLFLIGKRELALLGCDILDGKYQMDRSIGSLQVAGLAAKAGLKSRIMGFSFNDEAPESIYDTLREISPDVQLFSRDAVSTERLVENDVSNVITAGDVAFLAKAATTEELDPELQAFIDRSPRLIGVNLQSKVFPAGDPSLGLIIETLKALCGEGYHLLLIPHAEPPDVDYLAPIYDQLKEEHPDRVRFLDPIPHYSQIKRAVASSQHVYTCRLHLAIASLGMCTAVTCFPYQGKFEGQFRHFGFTDGLYSPGELPDTQPEMLALFKRRIDQSSEMSEQIESRLPHLEELARTNFVGV